MWARNQLFGAEEWTAGAKAGHATPEEDWTDDQSEREKS